MTQAGSPAPIAHTANSRGQRHELVRHLVDVGDRAAGFGAKFGATDLARLAGLWHDLGKFHADFQKYLYRCELEPNGKQRGPDHKAAGSSLAMSSVGWFLAMVIAGHHGGLQDKDGVSSFAEWLTEKQHEPGERQARYMEALQIARQHLPNLDRVRDAATAEFRAHQTSWHTTSTSKDAPKRQLELLIRMIFSCLVDADFLDTERHFQEQQTRVRELPPEIGELWSRFERHHQAMANQANAAPHVLRVRTEVYEACVEASSERPGFFRLTVPTGGGKTLSGLAFGIRHAMQHGLDRVVFAVPYTSICEQTTAVYRGIFGDDSVVLEHHSAASMHEDERDDPATAGHVWTRLAAQNWDAPIVVTTTVQLLESLLGRKTSQCRKLHNLARSVIVLDEAQTLPTHLLDASLDVMKELVRAYGVSIVFCTATQPELATALGGTSIEGVQEIVPAAALHFAQLKRVRYEWPPEAWSSEQVAERMSRASQALAILNTRAAAQEVGQALERLGVKPLHLSTQLCGAHRLKVLEDVRQRLSGGLECRLVSTQVVEAGVDLDFSLVLRAFGPLDRIAQAAGRCNRAGLLEHGRVIIFQPQQPKLPKGDYSIATAVTRILRDEAPIDPDDPNTFPRFFQRFYDRVDRDKRKVQALRESWSFRQVAHEGRVINDDTCPVIVPYGAFGTALAALRSDALPPRLAWRQAQPYVVNLRWYELQQAEAQGLVERVREGRDVWFWRGSYDATFGLDLSPVAALKDGLEERADWA